MSFNDYEQLPHKGDPKQVGKPGLASGFASGAEALPGGNPMQDDNQGDNSDRVLNDQGGDLGYMKGGGTL